MKQSMRIAAILASALALAADAQPGGGPANQNQASSADRQIYGWQLMTPQERQTYHNQMRSLQTNQERDQLRQEHHRLMQGRAHERGVTLPDQPRPPAGAPATGAIGDDPDSGRAMRGTTRQ